ncbi:MAG: hypothetical protein ACXWWQ_02860 [Candidatus Limnocylindria bacterium]
MSRAERRVVPPAPRLGRAIREAGLDLYYNSVRLVPANLLWGLSLLVILFVVSRGLILAPLLVLMVPLTMGLMGMATTLVRRRRLFWSDAVDAVRGRFLPLFAIGVAQLLLSAVAATDILIGLQLEGTIGPIVVIGGIYTLAAIWLLAVTTWPLLLDPVRAGDGVRRTFRLGLLLAIAHPIRLGILALLLAVFLVVSTVLAAALGTVSGAVAMLVAAHYVLPAADRLEGRATVEVLD